MHSSTVMRSRPNMIAMIPPVLVPPIRSKCSHGFGVSESPEASRIPSMILPRIIRLAIPRIPPPSRDSILMFLSVGSISLEFEEWRYAYLVSWCSIWHCSSECNVTRFDVIVGCASPLPKRDITCKAELKARAYHRTYGRNISFKSMRRKSLCLFNGLQRHRVRAK